jgi:hypothetical protein
LFHVRKPTAGALILNKSICVVEALAGLSANSLRLVMDGSLGKTFQLGTVGIKPEFYVDNILNHQYLLKGSFFSGAAWEMPRSFLFKVSVNVD